MDNKTDSSDQLFTNQKHPKDSSTQNHPEENGNCWKILIVDDKSEAHQVAKLALKRLKFENKALEFYSAFSAQEAREMLRDHTDIALILLDVVMESDHAGLELAQYIRDILTNKMIRIIIRTGQPGKAPEELVFMDYDINDYTTKTELTREKITTAVIGALRSYRDLTTIEHQKKELQKINRKLQQEIELRQKLEAERLEQEKLRMEKEFLAKQTEDLLKLNADKDKFFSIVAHDLKGPFLPVLGNAELLIEIADQVSVDEIRERCKTIYDAGSRVIDLLDNLLQWSRMQMERINFEPVRANLNEVVENNIWLFVQSAANKDICLKSEINKIIPVFVDINMLNIVLRNLTSNAIKFTPPLGQVTIFVRDLQDQPDQASGFVEIAVRDTGIGMSQENQAKLFRIDEHYTTPGTNKEKGTGLGLIITKEMAERNGGRIWVESEPDQGTTFWFTVPTKPPQ
ncbi:MAG: response regulator [Anaerolineaceae bacterium]|nr:response regulator [Anaerolineaceae bacterium]MCB9098447.1 response regulator [Anaerolineales bacterium]